MASVKDTNDQLCYNTPEDSVMEDSAKYILLAVIAVIVVLSFASSILLRNLQKKYLKTGDPSYERTIRLITVFMPGIFIVLVIITIILMKKF